jgi:hypothetical protein
MPINPKRNAYFSRLYGLETVQDFEDIELRDLLPSNPHYTIKLFYDPAKFQSAAERRKPRGYLAAAKDPAQTRPQFSPGSLVAPVPTQALVFTSLRGNQK